MEGIVAHFCFCILILIQILNAVLGSGSGLSGFAVALNEVHGMCFRNHGQIDSVDLV